MKPLREILHRNRNSRGGQIAILQEIQETYGYLPKNTLIELAKETGRSLVDIYGVATFFKAFSLKPRGRHLVSVCLGTACHVRASAQVVEEFERQLGIARGETTPDNEFTLQTVNCLGACALGPVVVADGQYFSQVTPSMVKQILTRARSGLTKDSFKDSTTSSPGASRRTDRKKSF